MWQRQQAYGLYTCQTYSIFLHKSFSNNTTILPSTPNYYLSHLPLLTPRAKLFARCSSILTLIIISRLCRDQLPVYNMSLLEKQRTHHHGILQAQTMHCTASHLAHTPPTQPVPTFRSTQWQSIPSDPARWKQCAKQDLGLCIGSPHVTGISLFTSKTPGFISALPPSRKYTAMARHYLARPQTVQSVPSSLEGCLSDPGIEKRGRSLVGR